MKNKTVKRTLAFLLAVVLTLVMCPIAPNAEAAVTDTCPCCGKSYSSISWASSGYTNRDLSKPGHYKLIKAFTLSKDCVITGKVVVDVNGYLLRAAAGKRGFTVKSGAVLTIINRSTSSTTNNGRLEGQNTTGDGGAIYVEAGGTLNLISGRVVGTTNTGTGGAIYNAGTVNIYGGSVESGKTTKGSLGGGNIYNTGALNIYDGTVKGGIAIGGSAGANIYNAGTLYMENGNILGGETSDTGSYGGNIYSTGTMTILDGVVDNGLSQHHGGNLCLNNGSVTKIYGGTISNGKCTGGAGITGYGGNIYVDHLSELQIYGGTITNGQNTITNSAGGNLLANHGSKVYMYGGTLSYGAAKTGSNIYATAFEELADGTKVYSEFHLLGGTILASQANDVAKGATDNVLKIYNCRYTGSTDITAFLEDCTCCVPTADGCVVWNVGYDDGTCTDCLYAQAMQEDKNKVQSSRGGHKFTLTGENTYTCVGCGTVKVLENLVADVNGDLFEKIEDALAALESDRTLTLMADASVEEAAIFGTLDLNGHTLTAEAFSAAGGAVIDTSAKNTGKLICDDVTLAENNPHLPVNFDGGMRFCPVGFNQWVEPVDNDTIKIRFYITQRTHQTILDDAVKAGNTDLQIQLKLTWTDANGVANNRTYAFPHDLLVKYAEKWNGRAFVATVSGIGDVTDFTCTYQVASTASTGATLSAKTQTPAGYINEKLSWEAINSFPIKRTDMTVAEMRQLCVDFMTYTKTYLWTPSLTTAYIRNAAGSKDTMSEGTVYGGLPYVGVASGNVYRMMDYIDPETGILDMQKALPALGTKERLTMADLKYFGSQCSIAVYWGWGRVMNSAKYQWTSSCVPKNNFVILGDIQMDETITSWKPSYNTVTVCEANGEQVMFGAYAQCLKADGMVYYREGAEGDGAGHLVMVYTDAVVVYKTDGTIDGENSYLSIIDQGQTWATATNAAGDTFKRKNSVGEKKTFSDLYDAGYVPFTFQEFLGTAPIEETAVALTKNSETFVSGTVSETDRTFQAEKTTDMLNWSDLMGTKLTSNYGIVDAYITIKDSKGNELYKHAVRTGTAGNKALTLVQSGEMVTTWETGSLVSGRTYDCEIQVQLATGERPVIYEGLLIYDK